MMCHFQPQNGPFVLKKFFFGTNHYYCFHLPIGPFHGARFEAILTVDPELWECAIFGPKMVHLPPIFFGKSIKSFSSTYQPLLLCKIRSRVMRMRNFLVQNDPFPQMRIFFRKPINEPCFFHSCLSTCQKSKSNINLLVKYWQLKNTEISLAESHFWL